MLGCGFLAHVMFDHWFTAEREIAERLSGLQQRAAVGTEHRAGRGDGVESLSGTAATLTLRPQ